MMYPYPTPPVYAYPGYPGYPAYPTSTGPTHVTNFYPYNPPTDNSNSSYSSEESSPSFHPPDNRPVLRIRKHSSKSSLDPRFQEIPSNLRPNENGIAPFTPVRVTIQRRTPEIQPPIVYPVPVYVPPPVAAVPAPLVQPILPQARPDYRLAQPIQTVTKPLSPVKVRSPPRPAQPKYSPPPPPSDRYETETFSLPSRSEKAELRRLRPPVRIDSQASRARSRPIIVDEYEKPKATPPGPSYRPLLMGKTTREMENEEVDEKGTTVFESISQGHNVTYRDPQRR